MEKLGEMTKLAFVEAEWDYDSFIIGDSGSGDLLQTPKKLDLYQREGGKTV